MKCFSRILTLALSLYGAVPPFIDGLVDKVEGELDQFAVWVRRRKMRG